LHLDLVREAIGPLLDAVVLVCCMAVAGREPLGAAFLRGTFDLETIIQTGG
jgi:hypothetical protein